MNFAYAICCLAAVVVISSASEQTASEVSADVAIKAKECAAEFKISPETVKEVHESKEKSKIEASDDLKCYSKCISDKIGLFDGEKVNVDRLVEIHVAYGKEESKIRASAAICKAKIAAEKLDCDSSWKMYTCFADNL